MMSKFFRDPASSISDGAAISKKNPIKSGKTQINRIHTKYWNFRIDHFDTKGSGFIL